MGRPFVAWLCFARHVYLSPRHLGPLGVLPAVVRTWGRRGVGERVEGDAGDLGKRVVVSRATCSTWRRVLSCDSVGSPGEEGCCTPPPSNDDVTGVVARITDSPHPSALVIEKRGWLARWCPIHLPGLSTSEMGNSTAEHAALRRTYNQTYALYARRPLSVK